MLQVKVDPPTQLEAQARWLSWTRLLLTPEQKADFVNARWTEVNGLPAIQGKTSTVCFSKTINGQVFATFVKS